MMETKPTITLSDEQQRAVDLILDWATRSTELEFKLGGYAGTGKTTVIKEIRKYIEADCLDGTSPIDAPRLVTSQKCCIASFTGKAVSVLRKKGLTDAGTLHSLLYHPQTRSDGSVNFVPKETIENENLGVNDPDIVIVDEASMVSTELYNVLMAHNKKVLWVGDPGQLEPVGDNPNLMKEPDYVLSTIHRQAAESPILRLADDVRHRRPFLNGRQEGCECIGEVEGEKRFLEADVVICGFNNVRGCINHDIRQRRGFKGTLNVGERIIVLQNNSKVGVFNGQMLLVDRVRSDNPQHVIKIDATDPDTGQKYPGLELWEPLLSGKVKDIDYKAKPWDTSKRPKKDWIQADYGYALTCHKSQGSEWDTVLVMEPSWWGKDPSKPMFDKARWRYTAITRAAKHLIYCRK